MAWLNSSLSAGTENLPDSVEAIDFSIGRVLVGKGPKVVKLVYTIGRVHEQHFTGGSGKRASGDFYTQLISCM